MTITLVIAWLTWWFGYIWGRLEKADGAAEATWKPIAENAAAKILLAFSNDKTDATEFVEKVAFDDSDYMDAIYDYIDNA